MAKQLVFVGGGHAHLFALSNLRDYTEKGHRVLLISPSGYQYYSGMGPGMLSGIYEPRQIRFNVKKLVQDRGGTFVEGRVTKIDAENRKLFLHDGQIVPYDVASFNIGSEVPADDLAVQDESIIPIKPIDNLRHARELLGRHRNPAPKVVVVGGGAAGVEIAANVWRLLRDRGASAHITLVAGGQLLPRVPEKARMLAAGSLLARDIQIIEGHRVQSFQDRCAILTDSSDIPYDYAFLAVGVKPAPLFRDSGLPVEKDGGLSVNPYLQSIAYPELFGGGDCISMPGNVLPRVGVQAVRQSGILHHNLGAALEGGAMRSFDPRPGYMLILNMGDGKGIMWKSGLVWNGRSSFLIKDYIDRRFMRKFQVSGELCD